MKLESNHRYLLSRNSICKNEISWKKISVIWFQWDVHVRPSMRAFPCRLVCDSRSYISVCTLATRRKCLEILDMLRVMRGRSTPAINWEARARSHGGNLTYNLGEHLRQSEGHYLLLTLINLEVMHRTRFHGLTPPVPATRGLQAAGDWRLRANTKYDSIVE